MDIASRQKLTKWLQHFIGSLAILLLSACGHNQTIPPRLIVNHTFEGASILDLTPLPPMDEEQKNVLISILSAMVVRNGEIHLKRDILPDHLDHLEIVGLVRAMNEEIRAKGLIITSPADLASFLNSYGGPRIDLQRYSKTLPGTVTSQQIIRIFLGEADCSKFDVHNPHWSYGHQKVKAKAGGECVLKGLEHTIPEWHFNMRLYAWLRILFGDAWILQGGSGPHVRKGHVARWSESTVFVLGDCKGTTRYRANGSMSLSFPGYFYYPGATFFFSKEAVVRC